MFQGIELLQDNHTGVLVLKNGTIMNYGVIRIDKEKKMLVHYTAQGLREMWKPTMTEEQKAEAERLRKIRDGINGEEQLIASQHITITPLDMIQRVIF